MGSASPVRLALCAIDFLLLGSWVLFASESMALPFAAAVAAVVLSLQVLLWLRLNPQPEVDHTARADRIVQLIGRGTENRKPSIRDENSGLYTRWYLEARIHQEALRCDRYSHSMAVVVIRAGGIELTEFSIDSWQTASAATAERCVGVLRNIDLSAFLGPFEYALCLIQCDREGAERVIERLRSELNEFACYVGVAVYPGDGGEALALIDLARMRSRAEASSTAAA